ncbi:MAG: hypothetical protein AB1896_16405 [Thermodesulfobacteriota bacterium]
MFEQKAVKEKILELYPDIARYALDLEVKKDRLIGAENYVVTLSKDNRSASFKLGREDVQTCMDGNLCSLITLELSRFIRRFIDESYALPAAG